MRNPSDRIVVKTTAGINLVGQTLLSVDLLLLPERHTRHTSRRAVLETLHPRLNCCQLRYQFAYLWPTDLAPAQDT